MTMREVVDSSAYIANSISIPVIADADTGYGSVLNTVRTVQEFERAGLARCLSCIRFGGDGPPGASL